MAIFANNAFPTIGFGPFFLLICAFGAWFVGNPFAVLIGLFIGVIQVQTGQALALDDNPIVMALQFCSTLAVVLMLGVARAALELEWRFARVDPLTGALNRKAFFEAVKSEAHQPGIPVLLFADVDGLKRVNDDLGHEAGDDALQDFANRVRNTIRNTDIFARIGGDEFVIFLRVRDLSSADIVAKRVNSALNLEGNAKLKCSIGALVMPAGSKSIDAELKQADSLMYHAKREKLGMVMAISAKSYMQQLIPPAPSTNYGGEQRVAIRARGRETELTAQAGLFD
ncbi:GGDEF domain-containing protein [Aurantiacibacter gilvus]|uniref:diguanylate cyclase n=1 Tax=Aurantiacibacter gilvus TaxID=3139141 RepID=A0ABU9IEZ4_9SPHN